MKPYDAVYNINTYSSYAFPANFDSFRMKLAMDELDSEQPNWTSFSLRC